MGEDWMLDRYFWKAQEMGTSLESRVLSRMPWLESLSEDWISQPSDSLIARSPANNCIPGVDYKLSRVLTSNHLRDQSQSSKQSAITCLISQDILEQNIESHYQSTRQARSVSPSSPLVRVEDSIIRRRCRSESPNEPRSTRRAFSDKSCPEAGTREEFNKAVAIGPSLPLERLFHHPATSSSIENISFSAPSQPYVPSSPPPWSAWSSEQKILTRKSGLAEQNGSNFIPKSTAEYAHGRHLPHSRCNEAEKHSSPTQNSALSLEPDTSSSRTYVTEELSSPRRASLPAKLHAVQESSDFSPVYVSKHNTADGQISYSAIGKSATETCKLRRETSCYQSSDQIEPTAHTDQDGREHDSLMLQQNTGFTEVYSTVEDVSLPLAGPYGLGTKTVRELSSIHSSTDSINATTAALKSSSDKQFRNNSQSLIGRKRKDARDETQRRPSNPELLARRSILRPRNPTPTQRRSVTHNSDNIESKLSSPEKPRFVDHKGLSEQQSHHSSVQPVNRQLNSSSRLVSPQSSQTFLRKRSISTQDYLREATRVMDFIRSRHLSTRGVQEIAESHTDECVWPTSSYEISARLFELQDTHDGFRRRRHSFDALDSHANSFLTDDGDVRRNGGDYADMLDASYLTESKFKPRASSLCLDTTKQACRYTSTTNRHARIGSMAGDHVQLFRDHGNSFTSLKAGKVATIQPDQIAHLIESQQGNMKYDKGSKKWVRKHDAEKRFCQSIQSSANGTEYDPLGEIPDLEVDALQEASRLCLTTPTTRDTYVTALSEAGKPKVDTADDEGASTDLTIHDLAQAQGRSESENRAVTNDELERKQASLQAWSRSLQPAVGILKPISTLFRRMEAASTMLSTFPMQEFVTCTNQDDSDEDQDDGLSKSSRLRSPSQHLVSSHRPKPLRKVPLVKHAGFKDHQTFSIFHTNPDGRTMSLSLSMSTPAGPKQFSNSTALVTDPICHSDQIFQSLSPISDTIMRLVPTQKQNLQITADTCTVPTTQPGILRSSAAVDKLVAKLMDTEPDEPCWDWLKKLNLQGSGFETLYMLDDFCPQIEELDASRNQLRFLEGLPETILQLSINSNLLNKLTSWSRLSSLQYLDVSDNTLETLEGLSGLLHLREIKADRNRISGLQGVLHLSGLLSLSLSGNEICEVDFRGSKLTRLNSLCLSRNKISRIRGLGWLSSASMLDLRSNFLNVFETDSDQLAVMPNLKSLHVDNNSLCNLDVAIAPKLEVLTADCNTITALMGLRQHSYLRSLSLRYQSNEMSNGAIGCMWSMFCNLRDLSLSGNKISCLHESERFFDLHRLELADTGLTTLPPDFASFAPNLRELDLRDNSIKDTRPLRHLGKLRSLDLSGNLLFRLRRTISGIGGLSQLEQLDLRRNPFSAHLNRPKTAYVYKSMNHMGLITHQSLGHGVSPHSQLRQSYVEHPAQESSRSESTLLRTKLYELLLASQFCNLKIVDGTQWQTQTIRCKDRLWHRLVELGLVVQSI